MQTRSETDRFRSRRRAASDARRRRGTRLCYPLSLRVGGRRSHLPSDRDGAARALRRRAQLLRPDGVERGRSPAVYRPSHDGLGRLVEGVVLVHVPSLVEESAPPRHEPGLAEPVQRPVHVAAIAVEAVGQFARRRFIYQFSFRSMNAFGWIMWRWSRSAAGPLEVVQDHPDVARLGDIWPFI